VPEIILDSPISLWFDNQGHEAALFYVSLLPNSCIENIVSPNPGRPPLVVEFTLGGTPYMVLNGGPQFEHTEAASILVLTEGQDETDRLWDALIAGGGRAGQCGWLKDRFGVSWQIVPQTLPRLLSDTDRTEPPIAVMPFPGRGRFSMIGEVS
jgi:predicted 3-demethylubiquinone-9 3-methyltransferase (glyoxalase superfamily)